jgi:hypothetical protein
MVRCLYSFVQAIVYIHSAGGSLSVIVKEKASGELFVKYWLIYTGQLIFLSSS